MTDVMLEATANCHLGKVVALGLSFTVDDDQFPDGLELPNLPKTFVWESSGLTIYRVTGAGNTHTVYIFAADDQLSSGTDAIMALLRGVDDDRDVIGTTNDDLPIRVGDDMAALAKLQMRRALGNGVKPMGMASDAYRLDETELDKLFRVCQVILDLIDDDVELDEEDEDQGAVEDKMVPLYEGER